MSKNVTVKNYDRFIRLGIAIAALRKIRGLSQEKLAEKAGISRSLMSVIEAPNTAHSFSMEVFFDIADALAVDPADLLNATIFPDSVLKNDNSDLHGEKKKKDIQKVMSALTKRKGSRGETGSGRSRQGKKTMRNRLFLFL